MSQKPEASRLPEAAVEKIRPREPHVEAPLEGGKDRSSFIEVPPLIARAEIPFLKASSQGPTTRVEQKPVPEKDPVTKKLSRGFWKLLSGVSFFTGILTFGVGVLHAVFAASIALGNPIASSMFWGGKIATVFGLMLTAAQFWIAGALIVALAVYFYHKRAALFPKSRPKKKWYDDIL